MTSRKLIESSGIELEVALAPSRPTLARSAARSDTMCIAACALGVASSQTTRKGGIEVKQHRNQHLGWRIGYLLEREYAGVAL